MAVLESITVIGWGWRTGRAYSSTDEGRVRQGKRRGRAVVVRWITLLGRMNATVKQHVQAKPMGRCRGKQRGRAS